MIVTENSQPSDMDVMETELVQVVIEIIHIVMWSGIIGSDVSSWMVGSFILRQCFTIR